MNLILNRSLNKRDAFRKEELRRKHISSLRISGFQIKVQKQRNLFRKREKRIF
ncbi:hypothetical protein LEP1GSC103_0182 [Leptospira borgpetersenii serovar Javanica str. UI 09931]|uniref:Uncharacterized protein n=5 Tax=Leptospira borgpetersenii TaxID=174 RepID=M3HRT0_LEPBO|nr:hypothetical protein LBBP_03433 [Leptospira borgpetersenii serovar Ballum]EKP14569.1 hypothetical protein LEP1GSC128_1773 [Leptospira borgpetersenii str. 200801926]EKQ92538.1 hypothetical protein LEP1GSC101_2583 [Leptospira borgpetersenii str. UI 09149]EKQ99498.1 hypothetical protein LEP1GSC121_1879 [Leptospira borgpetersenii serovar Castellonis str. 200801910]EMG00340.1 hypothetical protein LEP1GSC123_2411 [Leptospira borgpetersenii str. 200701203]EMK11172.1 hypothetical protein LEP1GSC066